MDPFRRLLQSIASQLALLNLSQRLAIALCAVVVVGSLLWLIQWSATPELVILLDQEMSPAELKTAQAALDAAHAEYRVIGMRLWVAPGEKNELLNKLNRADALPQDISIGFDKLIADSTPFLPESEAAFRRTVALGNELAKVIAASPDVKDARVFITAESKRSLVGKPSVPTASVHVVMESGKEVTRPMADSFALLVARAVPNLDAHNVSVIDALRSRSFVIPRPEEAAVFGQLDEVRRRENYELEKIMKQLDYIPGVLATVSVELDTTKSTTRSLTYDKPEEMKTTADVSETTGGSGPSEPGVGPNVGAALGSGESGGRTSSERTQSENFEPKLTEEVVTERPPFSIKRTMATIKIPRSFFVSVHRAQTGNAEANPTDEDIKPLMELEFKRVRDAVKKVVMAQADADVEVSFFYDFDVKTATFAAGAVAAAAAANAQAASTMDLLRDYGPQAGLAGLALVSLLMMALIVRRSGRSAALPIAEEMPESVADEVPTGEEILTVGGGPVGQAEVSEAYLVGQEVDEATLRYKQITDQVTKLVEENPESAAELIRHWVEQDA